MKKNITENFEMKKILILSRHGLRNSLLSMSNIVKKEIYKLEEHENNIGKLTTKGAVLELYFGQYIKEYLTENKFINGKNIDKIEDICKCLSENGCYCSGTKFRNVSRFECSSSC